MTEMRFDPLKGMWVIVAEGRRKRPILFNIESDIPEEDCPFCEGNEKETPEEIFAIREATTLPNTPGWQIRVIPNKYPAVEKVYTRYKPHPFYKRTPGRGYHEIIVESPDHTKDFIEFEDERKALVLEVFRDRYNVLQNKDNIVYVQIFRNKGRLAGASIFHPHTQVLAVETTPEYIGRESASIKGDCVVCKMINIEKRESERLVIESDNFVVFCPFASRFAYETMITPKRHTPSYGTIKKDEIEELSGVLSNVYKRYKAVLGEFDYNLILHSLEGLDFHWHFEFTPRIAGYAGFEVGTGFFINTVSPEKACEELESAE